MRFERCTFPVTGLREGPQTRWQDGTVEFDAEELTDLVREDPDITSVRFDAVSPGDSARIVNFRDFVEPMVKMDGPGTVYPGLMGRPVGRVGEGRTHRLGGMAVVQCADPSGLNEEESKWPPVRRSSAGNVHTSFIDMSGPGNATPFSKLHNLCVTLEAQEGLSAEDWHSAMTRATLKVVDRLAQTIADLDPPETEVFDMTPAPELPGVASIFNLASDEWFCGARSVLGTSVYGQTRLSAPWVLSPTELLDGAIFHSGHSGSTWSMTNNPIALRMAREHGKTCNYVGALIQRTNWTTQAEKDMAADRLAHLAKSLGVSGAVVTTDIRGQRFVETILGVRACEQAGISTVLLTQEEDNEDGTAPPLLISAPEVVSVVSTGTGGQEQQFPAVQRAIGSFNDAADVIRERAGIHGQYGQSYFRDDYGFGGQGLIDY
jgi:sarcosine reductase